MRGLDYAGLLRLQESFDLENGRYDLELGSFRIEELSSATVRSLIERRELAARILVDCFLHRPVMWDAPAHERSGQCLESLRSLERDLDERAHRLAGSGAGGDEILATILKRWADLSAAAVRNLHRAFERERTSLGSTDEAAPRVYAGDRLPEILGAYRRAAYAPVSALIQVLADDDDTAERARARLREGKEAIVRFCGIAPDDIEEATWSPTARKPDIDEPTMVTWGIP